VAVLYMGAWSSERGQLVSIDAPAQHQGGQCCYPVTARSDGACDLGN
jgi:hypothetical protein